MSFQPLYEPRALTMGSGGSVGSVYLGGLSLAGLTAVGAFSSAIFTFETSAGPADGTYGPLQRAGAPAGVGTALSLGVTAAGTAYRFDQPVGPVYWLRATTAGTNQTADRTVLIYGRP